MRRRSRANTGNGARGGASARSQEEDQRREFAVPLLFCMDGYRELVDCTQTKEDEDAENAAAAENSQAVLDLHDGAQRVPDSLRQLGWALPRRPVRLRWSHAVDAESRFRHTPRSVAGTPGGLRSAVGTTMPRRGRPQVPAPCRCRPCPRTASPRLTYDVDLRERLGACACRLTQSYAGELAGSNSRRAGPPSASPSTCWTVGDAPASNTGPRGGAFPHGRRMFGGFVAGRVQATRSSARRASAACPDTRSCRTGSRPTTVRLRRASSAPCACSDHCDQCSVRLNPRAGELHLHVLVTDAVALPAPSAAAVAAAATPDLVPDFEELVVRHDVSALLGLRPTQPVAPRSRPVALEAGEPVPAGWSLQPGWALRRAI